MKKLVSLFLLLIVLTVSGCSTVPVDEIYPAEIAPGEYQNVATIIFKNDSFIAPKKAGASNRIITFASDDSGIEFLEEDDIVSCIENSIKKQNPDQTIISYFQFVETILLHNFLWAQYSRELETYSRLLADEEFYKDVLAYGVRYLIFVSGTSKTVGHGGHIALAEGGVWGVAYWDNKTQLAASILDLHQKKTIADGIEVISEDISWLAMVSVFPAGFPSSTESDSCEDVGDRISKILLERAKQ